MIRTNCRAVVTGASRGFGKAIARKLWNSGASLALVARSENDLKNFANELKLDCGKDQTIEYFVCDLAELNAIFGLIEEIKDGFGDPDVLINNAGIQGPVGQLLENDWKEWQQCINILLMAPVLLCRGFLPAMVSKHYGKIINISGGGATRARPNFTGYATAKCGLVRFTETLAEEVKASGVCANCVAPGAMASEMTREIIKAGIEKAGELEYHAALKLLNSKESMQDRAADLVLFLASDRSDGITGKLISAVWDPWDELPEHLEELRSGDVYTLRRIVPEDRGMNWGD